MSPLILWRRLDSGEETVELLSRWVAELTLAAIPYNEPLTRRAKIISIPCTRLEVSDRTVFN